jgi:hypothetical protein
MNDVTPHSDLRDLCNNQSDYLVAGGIDFDLKIWTKVGRAKQSPNDVWNEQMQLQFGVVLEDDEELLDQPLRIKLYIKKVAVPVVERLLQKADRVKIFNPHAKPAVSSIDPDTINEQLQAAMAWANAIPELEKQFKRGVTLYVEYD